MTKNSAWRDVWFLAVFIVGPGLVVIGSVMTLAVALAGPAPADGPAHPHTRVQVVTGWHHGYAEVKVNGHNCIAWDYQYGRAGLSCDWSGQ